VTPTCTARPYGAFFHGDHHIRFDQHGFFMRNDKAVYDFEDNFQDNFQDNFEGETLANPL
jgi:hypothetical protein